MTYRNVFLSKNKIEINTAAASALITDRTGLVYWLEILIPDGYLSSNFISLVRLQASEVPPYNQGGIDIYEGAYFPIEDYIDSLMEYTAPKFEQDFVSLAENLTKKFYIKKSIENNGLKIFEEIGPIEFALKGGIDDKDFPAWRDIVFSKTEGLAGRFLTHMPYEKLIQTEQQEYLYWLANGQQVSSIVKLMAEVKYKDGSINTRTVHTVTDVLPFGVYCLPVSPIVIGVQEDPKEVIGYTVWMESGGVKITEDRTYVLDLRYRRHARFLIFANSLGGFDTITMLGRGVESLKLKQEEYERYVPFSAQATYAERIINKVTGERMLDVSTGYIGDNDLKYLQDLMFSKEIYLVTDRQLIPLISAQESYVVKEDDIYANGRVLSFKYANAEYSYSNLMPPPQAAARATEWRVFGIPKCLNNTNGIRTGLGQYPLLQRFYIDNSQPVVPIEIKNNSLGTDGYIGPIVVTGCEITPFLSDEYSGRLSFTKNNCQGTQLGTQPIYTVPAGRYGSEESQAAANALAVADWVAKNTQNGANEVGACRLTGWRGFGTVVCSQDIKGLFNGIGVYTQLERYYLDDNSAVMPQQIKSNVPGNIDYIAPSRLTACSITTYVNVAISRQGTFKKQGCEYGYAGTTALISIPAGVFGSAISQSDADAKANALFDSMNTQSYANTNGACEEAWFDGLKTKWWNTTINLPEPSDVPTDVFDTPNDFLTRGNNLNYIGFEDVIVPGLSNNFYMEANGQIYLNAGYNEFIGDFDDGVKIWINGSLSLDAWGWGARIARVIPIIVPTAGWYNFKIRWADVSAGYRCMISENNVVLPATRFRHLDI